MQPKKLEQFKYFQPIAWTLCISFAGFVMMLSLQLVNTVNNLQTSSLSIENRLDNLEEKVYPTGTAQKVN
jgi:hypothetical protein